MTQLAEVEGYSPSETSVVFGLPVHHFSGPEDSTLYLSNAGMDLLSDTAFSATLAATIPEALHPNPNRGFIPLGTPPNKVLQVGDDRNQKLSSVYDRDSFIIKTTAEPHEGTVQFGVMNWLQNRLAATSPNVSAPAQYGYILNRAGIATTIMEKVPGLSLQKAVHPYTGLVPEGSFHRARQESAQRVYTAVQNAIGKPATLAFVNDVWQHGHYENILVTGIPGDSEAHYGVIDQPSFTRRHNKLTLPFTYKMLSKLTATQP